MANSNIKKFRGKATLYEALLPTLSESQRIRLSAIEKLSLTDAKIQFIELLKNSNVQNPEEIWEAYLDSLFYPQETRMEKKPEPEKIEKETHEEHGYEEDAPKEPDVEPQTRMEQAEKAGKKITEGSDEKNDWGAPEPIPAPTASQINAFFKEPSPISQNIPKSIPNEPIKPVINNPAPTRTRTPPPNTNMGRIPRPTGAPRASKPRWGKSERPGTTGAKKAKKMFVKAALRNPAVLWALAIAIGFLVFIIVIIAIVGAAVSSVPFAEELGLTSEFHPTYTPAPGPDPGPTEGPKEPPSICTGNPRNCLKDDFNFLVISPIVSKEKLLDVYNILAETATSNKYRSLLRSSGPTPLYFGNSTLGGCPARVRSLGNGTSSLTLDNYSLSGCNKSTRKSRIIHETGHIIRNGHMALFDEFEKKAYNKDQRCYFRDGKFSPPFFLNTYDTTYASSQGVDISGSNESFAEFISLHIVKEGEYPKKCPVGYNWVVENIYGGTNPGEEQRDNSSNNPNDNDCNGKYRWNIKNNKFLPKNFGDPECAIDEFKERNEIYKLLKELDPSNADFWFLEIIPRESSYNPNAWGCIGWNGTICALSPEPNGAWGLLQMRSADPPGKRGTGTTRGDVEWRDQIVNAVSHNKSITRAGLTFRYWGAACVACKEGGHKNKAYCSSWKEYLARNRNLCPHEN